MARNVKLLHRLRPERIRRDAAVAKAGHKNGSARFRHHFHQTVGKLLRRILARHGNIVPHNEALQSRPFCDRRLIAVLCQQLFDLQQQIELACQQKENPHRRLL